MVTLVERRAQLLLPLRWQYVHSGDYSRHGIKRECGAKVVRVQLPGLLSSLDVSLRNPSFMIPDGETEQADKCHSGGTARQAPDVEPGPEFPGK